MSKEQSTAIDNMLAMLAKQDTERIYRRNLALITRAARFAS